MRVSEFGVRISDRGTSVAAGKLYAEWSEGDERHSR